MNEIRLAKLAEDAYLPTRKFPQDAGIDFYVYGDYVIKPHTSKILSTGICIEIPDGYFGLLKPKGSSIALVGAGVVDSNYQGEIKVKLYNTFDREIVYIHGAAICQLVLIPIITPKVVETSMDLLFKSETDRGISGGING